jgi:hypothetical protein
MLKISDYIAAIRSALQTDVQAELVSEHARSQLLGAIEVLDKLQGLMEWSPEMLVEQGVALRSGSERLRAETRDMPERPLRPHENDDVAEPEGRLRGDAAHMGEWVDWLYAHRDGLEADRFRALEMLVRDVIQAALAAERRRISASDYSSMT